MRSMLSQLILDDHLVSFRFLTFVVFILTHTEVGVLQATNEASVLLEWKTSLDRQSQSVLLSWAGNNPCHNWIGVSCSNSTISESVVTRISLSSSSLRGSLHDLNFALFMNLQVLDLHNNSLFGLIPSGLANASQLKTLDLSFNDFSGVIPSEIGTLQLLDFLYLQSNSLTGHIPISIGNLSNLAHLYLFENELTGPIPQAIGMLSSIKLENLDLSSNNLTGVIPSSLGNLTHMYFFYLYDNTLSGAIPPELVGAEALMDLQISNNLLTGTIPTSFRNFTRLDRLYLSTNNLSGSFPKDTNLSKIRSFIVDNNMLSGPLPRVGELLESFIASNNLFSGPIPPEIGNARNLVELSLSRNQLSGPIPDAIGNLTSLKFLNLDDNMLHGTLPLVPINTIAYSVKNNTLTGEILSSICNSSFLRVFHVSHNNISGVLPQCFGNVSRLTSLNFNDNQLQGSVPRDLMNCISLEVLDLGNNMMSGKFPHWVDTLPQLQVLVLRSNRLHGTVGTSSSLLPFPKLRILDLSGNLFIGPLPSMYFKNFKAMMNINERERGTTYMGGDGIYKDTVELVVKGLNLKYERILTVLTSIDLSNNKFEGELPSNIQMLNSLRYLNLSHNHLTGQIPTTLEHLTKLESLDLSSNRVKGKIPMQLTGLTFLAVLNVSYNQLSGRIPRGGQFNTFGNDSYQGNTALCGLPLLKNCGDDEVPSMPLSPQQEDASSFFNGFTWESVVMGYGCGMVLGVGLVCLMFLTGKPKWVLKIVEKQKRRHE